MPRDRSGGRSIDDPPPGRPSRGSGGTGGDDVTQAIPMVEQPARRGFEGPGETAGRADEPSWADRTSPTRDVPRAAPAAAGPRVEARPTRVSRRRAQLSVRRIDPWSVFVTSLIVAVFLGVVLLVAVGVLYALLDAVGVLNSINDLLATIGVTDEGTPFVGLGKVLGISAVVAAVDVVLITVLATLFAFLYNVVASLTGGVVMTLSEGE